MAKSFEEREFINAHSAMRQMSQMQMPASPSSPTPGEGHRGHVANCCVVSVCVRVRTCSNRHCVDKTVENEQVGVQRSLLTVRDRNPIVNDCF